MPKQNNPILIKPVHDVNEEAGRDANMYSIINEEQNLVVDRIMCTIAGETHEHLFFLEAPGGCGKTYIYATILNIVRGQGCITLVEAWTGIAGLLLVRRTTLHRIFRSSCCLLYTSRCV